MRRNPIYTIGYRQWEPEQLYAKVRELGALLVDCRWSRRTRRAAWSGRAFEEALGKGYLHIREWGNPRYKTGRLEVSDFATGANRLEHVLNLSGETRRRVVLMCACEDLAKCHRLVVAARLLDRWGQYGLRHLFPPHGRGQGELFREPEGEGT